MTTNVPSKQPVSLTVEQALHQAVAHHQAGQLQDAERLYRAILQAQPNHPDANHNLGVLAVNVSQPAASLPYFKAALEANPEQGQYFLSYVEALMQAGQIDDARRVLEQGRQQGLNAEAIEALADRLEEASGNEPSPQEINELAALFNEGRYVEAETLAQAMTVRFPLHGFGWKVLGAVFKQTGRNADALEPMQKAAALSPTDAESHNNLGVTLREHGRLTEAEACYRRAIQINPHHVESHTNLGLLFQALGRLNEAEASHRRALQINPDFAMAHNNLGLTLNNLGKKDEAETCYRRALQIKSDFFEAHYNLGVTLQELGRPDEAATSYQQALQIKPDFFEAHYNLGVTLQELGRLDEAATSYHLALQINPDFFGAHYNLGNTLRDLGRLDEAEASYRHALQIKPDSTEANNNLGNTLKDLGRLDEAEASYRRALQINPGYAEAYYNLGNLLCDLDDLQQAAVAYQEALNIAPASFGLDAAVYLATLCYLDKNLDQCRSNLLVSQPILSRNDLKHKNTRNYWLYLDKLITWHRQSNKSVQSGESDILYVIGDSHSLSAHNVMVRYKEREMRCVAEWIAGCKQWHLGNDKVNRYKHKFETILARLPPRSTLLLCIGEIDCRHDEGIIKAWQKDPGTELTEIVQSTVDSYLRYVASLAGRYGHRIIVCGVPCTRIPFDTRNAEAARQLVSLIKIFNTRLESQTLAAGMDFLDVYTLTDRGDGVASGKWHIDNYHLLPSAVVEAFDRFCLHP